MSKYAMRVNVLAYVEAESWAEAEKKFYDAKPLAHYVEGHDVVYDVWTHSVEEIEETD